MKIIVCGAGNVGKSIVGYLTQGNNDIVVIDTDYTKLDELSKTQDIQTIAGSSSHPEILEKAGAEKADMIIAVTDSDEVNMITCQIAYSLFHIEKKIARIDAQDFLEGQWKTLFNEKSLPIDLIISPDVEIANSILEVLKIPGALNVISFADDSLKLIAFRCQQDCPLIQTPLIQMERIAPDLDISFVTIVRGGVSFIPTEEDKILVGDEVYFLVREENLDSTIREFGMEHNANERIVIFGGTDIARNIAKKLEQNDNISSCRIIDDDVTSARRLARELKNTVVLSGEMMSDVLLSEAGIEKADASIAVTNKDKDNLLASLLAKNSGVVSTLTLVNSRAYDNLINNLGDNIIIDRTAVTISSILQELRKAKLCDAYSLGRGFGEIWEVNICDDSKNIGKTINELPLSEDCRICALLRDNNIFYKPDNEKIVAQDKLFVFVKTKAIRLTEKLFS